jgi:hypothetical protein
MISGFVTAEMDRNRAGNVKVMCKRNIDPFEVKEANFRENAEFRRCA